MSAFPAELEGEWSVLLAACSTASTDATLARLRSLLGGRIDWQGLLALAGRHGVQPLLYKALQPLRSGISAENWNELEKSYRANVLKVLRLSRELIAIVHHLRESGLTVMPYKGPALAEVLYGDIALRQAGDIDLLVRREEFSRVQHVLAKLGYRPQARFSDAEQRAYLKSGYESVFDGPAGRNILEVQWAIQPRFYAFDFDVDGVFDRAVTVAVAGQQMKTASPEDLFLILTVHAAKHLWGRVIWICDLARLINLPSLDWSWIRSQAGTLGAVRIVNISMLLASQLLGTEIPRDARNWFPEEKVGMQLASGIQQRILSESGFSTESLAYFRFMMRLRERPSDRLRFLMRLAFTPGPSEWNTLRLPPRLFPLYRVIRLSRLLARVVRA